MDPVLLGTLINASAMVIVAVFSYLTRKDMRRLEENTNHIQDVLNATKDAATATAVKASRAEGFLEGRTERNDAEEDRADRDESVDRD